MSQESQRARKISRALTGRRLSDDHRIAISESLTGRELTGPALAVLKERLQTTPPRALEWLLISPEGELIRTCGLEKLCKEKNLSVSALRAAAAAGSSGPISRGRSAGWIVFAVKKRPVSKSNSI
jgi:hypothetical protein